MAGLKNLFVLDADAIQVLREMPDNSINCVQLYFPDPWQKKRHFKRRFVIHERMQLVEQKLELGVPSMLLLIGSHTQNGCLIF
jgi:tRNA (guanine-N7-)-methyltransferase